MALFEKSVRVWDAPILLFHWLLVALIAASWWTGEHHEMDWHRRSGYTILALLIFRIYWGLVGSRTARFSHFVRGPGTVLTYLRDLRRPYAARIGHNPAGGWSVVLLLLTVCTMVTFGLFSVDVDGLESGPLADYVSFDAGRWAAHWHHTIFNVLLALMALHVLAIAIYLVGLRHNLIGPMIHGRTRGGLTETSVPLAAPLWKIALGIVIAVGCTYVVAQGFRL